MDCTVVKRDERRWMFAGGFTRARPEIDCFSASLAAGAPLSAAGWTITPDSNDPTTPALLANNTRSHWWDGAGGRHCPSYVRGYDPDQQRWVERIYYAGAARHFLGPYAIGYLEWNGATWIDQPLPVFTANEY
ncbi:MAG TPA: hypothetical protein VGG74_37910 [Kofleriaceae bacterium]